MRCPYTKGYCHYAGIGTGCMNPGSCPDMADMDYEEDEPVEESEEDEEE